MRISGDRKSCLSTKLRLYNAFVVSVLLHGAKTWTLLKSEEQKLEAFNMSCQRRILGIRWYDFVTNATIINRTVQESVCDKITRQRHAMFGHVRRLPELTPAHMHCIWLSRQELVIAPTTGCSGNVHVAGLAIRGCKLLQQLEVDTGLAADVAWDTASDRVVWRAQRPIAGQVV